MWLLTLEHARMHLRWALLHQIIRAGLLLSMTGWAKVIMSGACLSLVLTLGVAGLERRWYRISSLIEQKLLMRLMHLMNLLRERWLCLTKRVLRILRKTATTVSTTSLVVETAIGVHHLLLLLLHVASLAQSQLLQLKFRHHHVWCTLANIRDCEGVTLNGHRSEVRSCPEPKW